MTLPGTALIQRVFSRTGRGLKYIRLFTELRANDRTYKIWGRYDDAQADYLITRLTRGGALNARKVMMRRSPVDRAPPVCRGIRFEM